MKKTRIWQILGLFVVILALSACGGNGEVDTSTPPELPEDAESLVMLAKFDLTLKTGIAIEDITTKSITENNFDDASLGIPDPGVTYEAVVTPGYIIILEADGETYQYHASGERVVQKP
jgi:hypothetical protein